MGREESSTWERRLAGLWDGGGGWGGLAVGGDGGDYRFEVGRERVYWRERSFSRQVRAFLDE